MEPVPVPVAVLVLLVAALAVVTGALVVVTLRARSRAASRGSVAPVAPAAPGRLDLRLRLAEQSDRLRAVRELHELVLPALTSLVADVDRARLLLTADPAAAERSALAAADTARHAAAELRRVTALVRDGERAAAGGAPPALADLPGYDDLLGLDDLPALVAAVRAEGLDVELTAAGLPREVPAGIGLAVVRIAQEALANALAHGGVGTRAEVRLTWSASGLELRVDDDGVRAASRATGAATGAATGTAPGTAPPGARPRYSQADDLAALTRPPSGRGITAMRGRAEVAGGVFTVRRLPGIGFSVVVVFPETGRPRGR